MQIDYSKISADELVQKIKSKEIASDTYGTIKEFYDGLRSHAADYTPERE